MKRRELYIISLILIVIGVLLAVVALGMKGEDKISGEHPESEPADAMVCVGGMRYPYLEARVGESSHSVKVNVMFDEGEMDAMGLYYDMVYSDKEGAEEAYRMLVPEMNLMLDKDGVDAQFMSNVRFMKNGEKVTMSLYVKKDSISELNKKYMMIEGDAVGIKKNELVENYVGLGFDCRQNDY